MLCCQQAEAKSDLDCNNIIDFVSMCFTLQMESDFAREAAVRSIVNSFPEGVEESLNGTPGAHVPVYKKCDLEPISYFVSYPLCLLLFLCISGVC